MNSRLCTAGGAVVDEMMVVSCSSASSRLAGEGAWGSAEASTVGAGAAARSSITRAGTARGDVKLPAAWLEDGIELTGGRATAGAAGAGVIDAAAVCVVAGCGAGDEAAGAAAVAFAVLGASGVGGFAAGFGSLLAFKVPNGTRCEVWFCAGTRSNGSAAGVAVSVAAGAGAAIGGGGASRGSTLISLCADADSVAGALVVAGKFAQADNPVVTASTDTNVLMSLCDRLFVTATGPRNPTRPGGDAKLPAYQVGPSYASLNIPLSCVRTTVFLTRTTIVKKPAVTGTAGKSV